MHKKGIHFSHLKNPKCWVERTSFNGVAKSVKTISCDNLLNTKLSNL